MQNSQLTETKCIQNTETHMILEFFKLVNPKWEIEGVSASVWCGKVFGGELYIRFRGKSQWGFSRQAGCKMKNISHGYLKGLIVLLNFHYSFTTYEGEEN